jgi:hypothetical protein
MRGRYRASAAFRRELNYCAPRGIPRSIFLGRVWPNPADPTEPQWLPEDSEAALAWEIERALICQCGHFADEVWDAAGADLEFEAVPHRCHACAEKERAARKFTETDGGGAAGDTAGLKWATERRG